MKCIKCGHEVPEENKFCEYCGTPVTEERRCSSCGAVVEEDSKFCHVCGTALQHKQQINEDVEQNVVPDIKKQSILEPQQRKNNSLPGQTIKKDNEKVKYGIGIGIIIICIAIVIAVAMPSNKETKRSVTNTQTNSNTSTMPEKRESYQPPADTNVKKYSINGISLEDSWRSVKDKLGTPLSSSDEDIYTRYKYPDLEVVVDRNNIVQAVVSLTSSGATKGVAVGDSLRDVVRQYGKDYAQSDYDDLTLYEYSFDTPTGKPALFRFAVNKSDQKVSYMSVRTLSDDVVKARNVFLDYHKAISNHNFNAAYSDLSQEMQANSGDVSAFSKGFETTLSSNVSHLHVVSVYPTSITFAYELEAEDRGPGLSRQTQRFNGTVTMIVENGQWKIGDMEAKKK